MKLILRNVVVLYLSAFISGFIRGFFLWFLPLYTLKLFGSNILALIYTSAYIISIVFSLIGGFIADRWGRKLVIALIAIVYAFTMGFFAALPQHEIALFLLAFSIFSLSNLGSSAVRALLSESIDREILGKALSILTVAGITGFVLGSTALGFMIRVSNINVVAYLIAVIALLRAISCLLLVETRKRVQHRDIGLYVKALKSMFSDVRLRCITGIVFIDGVAGTTFYLYLPSYLNLYVGIREDVIGMLYSAMRIAQGIGQPISGHFVDRYGEKKALLINAVGSASMYTLHSIIDYVQGYHCSSTPYRRRVLFSIWINSIDGVYS